MGRCIGAVLDVPEILDISVSINKALSAAVAIPVAWKQWPGMAFNASFDAQLLAAVPQRRKVVLLCRSGVRSVAAAQRAAQLSITAYNILQGFEGDADANGQRGWRFHGLPWSQ